ncbi:MAG: YbhB/YbcL family Raf kinase inhibitor-like protein [Candidatus Binataceae bacterium]|nr:YbhB/YbcL family Raf kinase inhibitor-like protein [Candidatus Binataceae bacterium]
MQTLRSGGVLFASFFIFIGVVASLCPAETAAPALLIHSSGFDANAPIPAVYTCSGENKSPGLTWTEGPSDTASFALLVEDPDAPGGIFIHWVVYNLPARRTVLPAGVAIAPTIAGGGVQGMNQRGEIGYHGPCPPPGRAHHYNFRLYALDTTLDLKPGVDAATLKRAMAGHVLARGDLIGTFAR